MEKPILELFKDFSRGPFELDRILVTSFLKINSLELVKNSFLRKYILQSVDQDYAFVEKVGEIIKSTSGNKLELEDLMQIFEIIISPKEKIVTGAVYTPLRIREYIVSKTLKKRLSNDIRIGDIACGCAGFLMTAALEIHKISKKNIKKIIEDNLFGLDIAAYSIDRSKIVLSLLALQHGEDDDMQFNLFLGNALSFNWDSNSDAIKRNEGFDCVIGNPPYVCSRNIDDANRALLHKWQVTRTGHPDLYIPFFEVAIQNLNSEGLLGYITVNTFFKSINGRALREYFSDGKYSISIIDFRNEQVFDKRNTYTCICFISKNESSSVLYTKGNSYGLKEIKAKSYFTHKYSELDHFNGWNLGDPRKIEVINRIESFEVKLFDNFTFSTGIATLKNSIYKFRPLRFNKRHYFLDVNGEEIRIEKVVCREIINSNKVTTAHDLRTLKEQIIFPYSYDREQRKHVVIPEANFSARFPDAYNYLSNFREELAKRDKGTREYETWFAYGRNQSLELSGVKLFFPHITNGPSFVVSKDANLLFYNGEAIVGKSEFEIRFLKKILESPIFWFYIKNTSKPYSSDYYSMGKNYMKQFSIPVFSRKEKTAFIKASPSRALKTLLKKFGLKKSDIQG